MYPVWYSVWYPVLYPVLHPLLYPVWYSVLYPGVSILYRLPLQPDTWVVNPYCQNVTCFLGEDYDVSDTACVENADCVEGGDDGFECVCEPGYQGDGYVLCEGKVLYRKI